MTGPVQVGPVEVGPVESILAALHEAQVRYIVVGGVAVVLHGTDRLTVDLDLVVDLRPDEASKAIDALLSMGLRPVLPVDPRQFADPNVRRTWIEEQHMSALAMFDPQRHGRLVDLSLDEPLPFDEMWSRADVVRLHDMDVRIASVPDLLQIKRLAGRPDDAPDVLELHQLQNLRDKEGLSIGDPPKELPPLPPDWKATFENTAEDHRRRFLYASPADRLEWLEDAMELARIGGGYYTRMARKWNMSVEDVKRILP